jgi:hypothetical protein
VSKIGEEAKRAIENRESESKKEDRKEIRK